ncbi:MAG: hypothetical protein UW94_C0001G0074 [Parcubacteria group bacterium GW2011_GWA2_45_14]|nr:MAG: hypothetical protein UW94_C0001G0074 [Parcubacteria group bacterium GW2011_GWA2_45_14]
MPRYCGETTAAGLPTKYRCHIMKSHQTRNGSSLRYGCGRQACRRCSPTRRHRPSTSLPTGRQAQGCWRSVGDPRTATRLFAVTFHDVMSIGRCQPMGLHIQTDVFCVGKLCKSGGGGHECFTHIPERDTLCLCL